jgi:hypothetical protein
MNTIANLGFYLQQIEITISLIYRTANRLIYKWVLKVTLI